MKQLTRHSTLGRILLLSCWLLLLTANTTYAQTEDGFCECEEFLYVNEPNNNGGNGQIHKYQINPDGSVTEIFALNGGAWYNDVANLFPSPHGLGTDLNGNIYIGQNFGSQDILQLDCDANVTPTNEFLITHDVGQSNIFSIGNTLYTNAANSASGTNDFANNDIVAYDVCTQQEIGRASLCGPISPVDWGFYVDRRTNLLYATANEGTSNTSIYVFTPEDLRPGNPCIEAIDISGSTGGFLGIQGIVTDNDGNVYVVARNGGAAKVIKYSPFPDLNYITESSIDGAIDGSGFYSSRGIAYSASCNCLFVSTEDPIEDCVSTFNTDLQLLPPAVGSTGSTSSKAIAVNKECCPLPGSEDFTINLCASTAIDFPPILLNELFPCRGIICGGDWVPESLDPGVNFSDCEQTVDLLNTAEDCVTATFTRTGNSRQCGMFTLRLTVNISVAAFPGIFPGETICNGAIPRELTSFVFNEGEATGYQWQMTTDATACNGVGAAVDSPLWTDVPGATMQNFTIPLPHTQNTFYRLIARSDDNCMLAQCALASNCLFVPAAPDCNCDINGTLVENVCVNGAEQQSVMLSITNNNETSADGYTATIDGGASIMPISGMYDASGTTMQTFTLDGASVGTTYTITLTDMDYPDCQTTIMVDGMDCCPVEEPPVNSGNPIVCGGAQASLLVVTVPAGQTVDWYDSPIGGTLLQSGSLVYAPGVFLPGTYTYYTEARAPGTPNCMSDTRTPVTLTILPIPAVVNQSVSLCPSPDGMTLGGVSLIDYQSLITSEANVSLNWYLDNAQTMLVPDPTNITINGSETFYLDVAFMDGLMCSATGVLNISLYDLPATPMSLGDVSYCDGNATPSLTVQNPGIGQSIQWYTDAAATMLVSGVVVTGFNGESIMLTATSNPALPTPGNTVTLYTQAIDDATGCISSTTTPVNITNNPVPAVMPTELTVCEDAFQSRTGVFDLSQIIDDANAGFMDGAAPTGGAFSSTDGMQTMTFHLSLGEAMAGTNAIATPMAFTNTALGGQTIFTRLADNMTGCYSTSQVLLSVAGLPDVDNLEKNICPDLNSNVQTGVDVSATEATIAGGNTPGTYMVEWFTDVALTMPLGDPTDVTVADGDTYYALVTFNDASMCQNIGQVTYIVQEAPPITDKVLEFCEDVALTGTVNLDLRDNDLAVSSGMSAIVNWFEDINFSIPVADPTNVTISIADNNTEANIFYADVSDGNCTNRARITLTVVEQAIAMPAGPYEICSGETGILIDASISGAATMGSWSITSMPMGGNGVVLPTGLIADPSTATFTATVPGDYILTLTTDDPTGPCEAVSTTTIITVHELPMPLPSVGEVCVGSTVNVDGNPMGGTAPYIAHQWVDFGTGTAAGYTLINANMQVVVVDANGSSNAQAGTIDLQYTVTDNNGCMQSATTTVTINPLPVPLPSTEEVCVGSTVNVAGNPMGGATPYITHQWVDLGTGTAAGYTLTNANMQVVVVDASGSSNAQAGTIDLQYTVTDNNGCMGTAITIVTINPLPVVAPTELTVCEDAFQLRTGIFDLSQIIDDVNAGFMEGAAPTGSTFSSTNGMESLTFYLSMQEAEAGTNPIANPTAFTNTALGGQTLFVQVENNTTGCLSVAQVLLSVAGLPDVDNLNLTICPDLNSNVRTGVDVSATEATIAGGNTSGTYMVEWFTDVALTMPLGDPTDVTISNGDTYYALVTFNDAPMCQNIGQVTYMIQTAPPIMDLNLEFCEDIALMGDVTNINLRDNDLAVGSGMASIVNWFEDSNFSIPVTNPLDITVNIAANNTEANIFYASVSDGDCTNRSRINITVFQQPVPLPAGPYEVCAEEVVTLSGASLDGTAMMGAWTITNMPMGGDGVVMPTGLISNPSIATFTATVAGDYTLTLTTDDPIGPCGANMTTTIVTVHPLPEPMPPLAEVCIGSMVFLDGDPQPLDVAVLHNYVAHQWVDLGTGTASGYTLMNTNEQVITIDATNVPVNAGAGTIELEYTVTDINGCMESATTTVMIHPLPIPNPMDAMVCVGDMVTVDANTTEGTLPLFHQWVDLGTGTATNYTLNGTDTQIITVNATSTADAQAGTVNLEYTVTGINGCTQSATITVTINPLPMIMPMDGNITCEPPREVVISVTTSAMNPTYMWTGPSIVTGGTTDAPIVNQPGTYTVTVTDGLTGCMNMVDLFVTQDPLSKCLPATFEIKVKGGE